MNDITCDVCRDLMPLVKDGIASADSRLAVERHLESCPSCRARFETPLPADGEKAFAALWNRLRLFAALVMMLCIFVGMDLTGGQGLFYNSLLMPFIGALGFLVFRWKAAYNIPLLLLAVGLVTCGLNLLRGLEVLDIPSLLWWTVIYSGFAAAGMIIAALLCFALKKED